MIELPYFDLLLEGRSRGDPAAHVFDRYVHWGYWPDPGEAGGTDQDFAAAMERLNGKILAEADLGDGQAILDAGCGFGGTLASLDARLRGAKLCGVNIDGRQLAVAARQRRAGNGNEVSWVKGDACALPFADASFDRVLAVECIFHFPSRRRFLQEVSRVLKPGGRLVLSDFVPWHAGVMLVPPGRWLVREIGRGYGTVGGWPDGGYDAMARAAGLDILCDLDVTAQTLPTYAILLGLIRREGLGGRNGRMLWPTRWLHWVSRLGLVRYRILGFRNPR